MQFMRRKKLLRILLAFGIVIFVRFVFMRPYNLGKNYVARYADRRRELSSEDASLIGVGDNTTDCNKTFLLYGIKEQWKKFLSHRFMSKYRYLIDFPRTLTCFDLNCKVLLKFSKKAKDLAGVDVVVFSNTERWLSPDMWQWTIGNRTKGQRWIFVSRESPLYTKGFRPPENYADLAYDWFASYKLDSDVYQPYGFYKAYEEPRSQQIDLKKFVASKTLSTAWMAKNCKPFAWNRHIFIESLSSLVNVDKFGSCGDKELPWHNEDAVREVLSKYKFYLALENTCCVDYITEKFWRSLDIGMVPVVVGASYEQYLKVAPPNSFIHVDQFESIEDLAMFLVFVGNDEEKYLEFHKWRNLGQVVSYNQDEKFISPLMDSTHCAILEKVLTTSPDENRKLEFWGSKWRGSCGFCGYKWIQDFGHKRH
ncbi:Alpha-(1,3)-fucosyltransferase 4 [Holothuria leucospilota]|uniref:Fucosyltransferase n=1 Tax=Holothuria leucospilota TaxID=206669 RepID=A0A9Q0YEM8_HOLLE|nr:Alpha-(1,3)-fucosyltransferase 4 [Holothuria leucospilota]